MNRSSVPYGCLSECCRFCYYKCKRTEIFKKKRPGRVAVFQIKSLTFPYFLQNLIDGAAFMGVGFDGRGEYSPESRKMSIVQRNCAGKAT